MDNNIDSSTIYNWFDKCGVISNIRTQLRQNLVNALKCKNINLSQSRVRSAKQYVHDLLIAEYLLKTNFVYSLSVFTSEAPLPAHFDQLLTSDDENKVGILQNDYLHHTLETLGINPQDPKGSFILSEYAKKNECLLICILKCLRLCSLESSSHKNSTKSQEVKEKCFRDKCTQTSGISHCDRCKEMIYIKKKLVRQKEDFDKALNKKFEKLKIQAQTADQQLTLLQEKMEQAQSFMQSLNAKRKQFSEEKRLETERLHEKKLELLHKEEFLTRETNRLEIERNSYKQFEDNLQRLQNELTKIKRGLSDDETKTNYDTRDREVQTDVQSFTMANNEKELLQREKHDLNILIQEQQERIKLLTHRAVQLSRQLEETQFLRINGVQIPNRVPLTSTIISEGSSTEDILQDAKIRLKRLEEESIKAEKRFNNYILKSIPN